MTSSSESKHPGIHGRVAAPTVAESGTAFPASLDASSPSSELQSTVILHSDSRGSPIDGEPVAQLGRYQLLRVVGRGGMGEVWRAYDPELKRHVAIKILRSDIPFPRSFQASFLEEGRRLARLNHPEIVKVYDCGREEEKCYLVSEYVDGGTLAERLKKGPLPIAKAVELAALVAEAAHHAHTRGLIHRDIKPSNILMRASGHPLLGDFGLAISEEELACEMAGTFGTFHYMSPEQMRGESHLVDSRSDVYSLGVVLYQSLTGRLPYLSETLEQYREQVLERAPRTRTIRDEVSPKLEQICLKCLARDRGDRYTTALDLSQELRSTLPVSKPSISLLRGVGVTMATLVIAMLVVAAGMNYFGFPSGKPKGGETLPMVPAIVPPRAGALAGKELDWLHRSDADWHVSPQNNAVHVVASGMSFYELGEYREGKLRLEVHLQQAKWGQAGLFFGGERQGPLKNQARIFQWGLADLGDHQGAIGHVFKFNLSPKSGERSTELARRNLQLIEARTVLLVVEVNDGQTVRLEFHEGERNAEVAKLEMEYEALSPGMFARHAGTEPLYGKFGLWCQGTQASFLNPKLNGKDVEFNYDRAGK